MLRLLTFLLVSGLWSLPSAVAKPRPNILILITDDQGYGELSAHGNPVLKTPHLDQLHSESIRLADFHVAPMCTPTRGQLMTGVDALRNGAMNVSSGRTLLRRDLPTIPSILSENGYQTGIFGKWHLGDTFPYRPEDRGFREALWFPSSHIGSVPDFWENDYFDDTYIRNTRRTAHKGYTTDVFFREAIAWMKQQRENNQPFFCYLPTATPHWPHFVPQEFRDKVRARFDAARDKLPKIPDAKARELVSYLAMIENIDVNFGKLDTFLSDSGLRDNTIVIFLNDNGSTFAPDYFPAGMRGRKTQLWEGGHRVSCFIRWPDGKLRPPCDLTGLTQVQDILPTLLDLSGTKPPTDTKFDGISLAPVLRGEAEPDPNRMLVINYSRMPMFKVAYTKENPSIPRRAGAGVLWKRWRLIEDRELYNLETDPMQRKNVIAAHQLVARKMRARLDQWWTGVEKTCREVQPSVIGDDAQNPVTLTACEWLDVFIDQQVQIRRGEKKLGTWHLEVAKAGTYTFDISKYPPESGLKLRDPVPETKVTDGILKAGPAWTPTKARLEIAGQSLNAPVPNDATSIRFQLDLPAGPTTMKATFLDESGTPYASAFYVTVHNTSTN